MNPGTHLLQRFKHSLARMLLKSVKVRDGQLQVVIGMP